MFEREIGIDLGTSSTLIYLRGKGIVLREPSLVAIDKRKNKVIAIGLSAKKMFEKVPSYIEVIRPLQNGIISDYKITEIMLKYFISKVISKNSVKKPKVVVCIPCEITEVERKAAQDSVKDAGARQVFIIEEPIAAAIGSGIDISEPCGRMIIDIGAGTTDIAVISLGKIVVGTSIDIAGDKLDECIANYIRRKHHVVIGIKTAEKIKKEIGTACRLDAPETIEIKGQSLVESLPISVFIDSNEVFEAIEEPINNLIKEVFHILEQTPPELSSDIFEQGIIMTGGGSLLAILRDLIELRTGVKTYIVKDVFKSVAIGAGKYIKHMNSYSKKYI